MKNKKFLKSVDNIKKIGYTLSCVKKNAPLAQLVRATGS